MFTMSFKWPPYSQGGYLVAIIISDDSPPAMVDWTQRGHLIQTVNQILSPHILIHFKTLSLIQSSPNTWGLWPQWLVCDCVCVCACQWWRRMHYSLIEDHLPPSSMSREKRCKIVVCNPNGAHCLWKTLRNWSPNNLWGTWWLQAWSLPSHFSVAKASLLHAARVFDKPAASNLI